MTGPGIRIVAGGRTGPLEEQAVLEAVGRVLTARDRVRSAPPSAWGLSGRLGANGVSMIRSRADLPTR